MHAPAICTIVAKNYLAHARCLTESFLAHHPDGRVFVLLADTCDGYFDPAAERFTTIEARDLGIAEFEQMAFRYTVVEFNTAVKPFLLEHLFEKYDLERLCYFDPDIYFYQPITHIYDLLADNRVVLTPHLLAPLDDDRMPDEPYILRAGVYNLGFIGLSRGPGLDTLLRWWQQRLVKDCVVDPARGLFVDQRWVDLVPGFFDEVAILRDPGYNAAYWNLKHRDIRCRDGQWRANDGPLVFYHFSGLPMSDIAAISKHQNRFTLENRPTLAPLFAAYQERLLANGYETVRRWPYAYAAFDGGVAIPDAARHLWRNLDGETRWPRPFCAAGPNSFLDWLNRDVAGDDRRQPLISNLAMELYRQRWDLQQAFPDVLGAHRLGYANWFSQKADEQYVLDPVFVRPVRESLAPPKPATRSNGAGPAAPRAPAAPPPPTPAAAPSGAALGGRSWLYYALRAPIRRLGMRDAVRRIVGPRRVEVVYNLLVEGRPARPIAEAPLLGRPTLRRRAYYAVRNPLRRLGLHAPLKRLIGQRAVERIYDRMVAEYNLPPEAATRGAHLPDHRAFFGAGAAAQRLSRGLNVAGYLRAETGMGEVPRAVLRALAALDYPVAQTDLSNTSWARSEDHSVLHLPAGSPHAVNLLCVNADMVPHVAAQLGPDFFAGKYNIGFWHWETANFPRQWHDRFAYFDEIWVDSGFVQKALSAVSPIPVVNVQLPINALLPSGCTRADLGLPEDRFIFLFSFDMRSFIQRKNPHGLIEAYRRAFEPLFERTTLVIKVTNADAFAEEAERLREAVAGVSGILIDYYLDRERLSGLFELCDCYVSLHRGEGFGLTIAEAMALGKPVIATAYSGNMEFMNPANSYLVGYRLDTIEASYGPYRQGDEWAEPDVDHAAELMRLVAANPHDAARKGARAAEDMRRFFGSEAVARRMIDRLDPIQRARADER